VLKKNKISSVNNGGLLSTKLIIRGRRVMKVELVKEVDIILLKKLVELESRSFGVAGLNEWHLVPFIRHGRVFAAIEQREAIGLIQYMRDWDNPQKAYLIGVSIAKEMRGMGLGTELIYTSLQALKAERMEEVELTVDSENCGAIRIYEEKLGFTAKCTKKDEYGEGNDRLVMTLSLSKLTT
jgi:ribosomal-protein-alanine N-acetyltransferase